MKLAIRLVTFDLLLFVLGVALVGVSGTGVRVVSLVVAATVLFGAPAVGIWMLVQRFKVVRR